MCTRRLSAGTPNKAAIFEMVFWSRTLKSGEQQSPSIAEFTFTDLSTTSSQTQLPIGANDVPVATYR
jgi:hypothetical protein